MKNIPLLFFLFCFSAAVGQQNISPDGILNGTTHFIDTLEELCAKTISEKYSQLLRNEKRIAESLDSLQLLIKNEKDELLKARLDIILLLIKNNKAGDVYEKMREFGDKAILDINKQIAAPAWFYKLDKEHAQLVEERKNVESSAKSMSMNYYTSNKMEQSKKEAATQATPYDSLKTVMKLKLDAGDSKSFMTEICKLYKQPVTTESEATADYTIERIIICGESPEVFERKTWVWGGVFCFYNSTNPIKEEDYLASSRDSMIKALNYREQHKTGEK